VGYVQGSVCMIVPTCDKTCWCMNACHRLVWLDLAYVHLVMNTIIGSRLACRFQTGMVRTWRQIN
jgi:hypothetical protein